MKTKKQEIKYNKYFSVIVKKLNISSKEITVINSNAPKELVELTRQIHKEFNENLLNDWIYDIISEAFFKIEEEYNRDTSVETILSGIEVDVYNIDLIEWSKNNFAQDMINEGEEEFGFKDFINCLQRGQYQAKNKIYHAVYDFIIKNNEVV